MKYLYSRRSNSLADERGFYLVFLAGSILALLAVMGLAVDVGMLEAAKLRLQRAVDASSIAATYLLEDKTREEIIPLARQIVLDNLYQTGFDPSEIVGVPLVELKPDAPSLPRLVRVSAIVQPPLKILRLIPWIRSRPTVSAEAESNNVRVAVALVLDRSKSMEDTTPCGASNCQKMAELKNAAIKFINQFGSEDRLALISFGSEAETNFHMTRMHDSDKVQFSNFIGDDTKFYPLGYTNTWDALTLARAEINSVSSQLMPFDFKSIVIVTDGAPRGDGTAGQVIVSVPSVPSGCLESSPPGAPERNARKRYIASLVEADNARNDGTTVYAIGLGQPGNGSTTFTCPPFPTGGNSPNYNVADPYQCATNDGIVKKFFLGRLTNDQEMMAGNPGGSPPMPVYPDFPTLCVPDRLSIASKPRGRFYHTANPADLDNLLLAIGRMIRARLTK